jgi:hypothetical protein
MSLARSYALPDEIRALARACSAADNTGDDTQWETWVQFATALFEAFPDDHVIITRRSYTTLSRTAMRVDPERMALVDDLVRSVKLLLRDFLDPSSRAIALGSVADSVRKIDSLDFNKEDRRGH